MENKQKSEQRFLTVSQAAQFLGLTENSVRKMIARNQIPHHRILPRRILLDRIELEQWVKRSSGISIEKLKELNP